MKHFLTVILLASIVYIIPLNIRPMSTPDESRYAEIPREMITSANWIVPNLNGLRYFEKPVFGYWMNAISILAFGENDFAMRLPSAVSVLITALIIFMAVRRFTGDEHRATLSAAVFLSFILVFAIGVFNVLDSIFSMAVTAMMAFFLLASQEQGKGKRNLFLVACGAACGIAFLTKGFLVLALAAVGIMPFLVWEKRKMDILRLAWIPALTAIIVILPWALAVHCEEKDYWRQFFWVEHIQRFFNPDGKAQHHRPAWYFLPFILCGIFPWLMVLPAAVAGLRRGGITNPFNRYLICWLAGFLVFFSASSGKLATYILPCFPPLAMLLVDGLIKQFKNGSARLFASGALLLAVLTASTALFLAVTQTIPIENMLVYFNEESWKWKLIAAGIAACSILALFSARDTNTYRRMLLFALSPMFFFFTTHFGVPQVFRFYDRECMDPIRMISAYKKEFTSRSRIIAGSYLAPAVCWVYKRTDIYLYEEAGEFSYGLSYPKYPEARDRLIQPREFRYFVELAKDPVTFMTDFNDYMRKKQSLPKPFFVHMTNGFVFAQYRHEKRK